MPLSDSVLRRQRAPSDDELSNIDTNLFEKRSQTSTSRHSSYPKRRIMRQVKRLTVLCSDILARNVRDLLAFPVNFVDLRVFFVGFVVLREGIPEK